MRVAILGPSDSPLVPVVTKEGHVVVEREAPLDTEWIRDEGIEFLVSYRYRHIIRRPILDLFPSRAVNLHVSLLPWNRGADPNLWSFLDDTPKGVTIHYLDEGVDTGDIIVQKEVHFTSLEETLATTYAVLNQTIVGLFSQYAASIFARTCPREKQVGQGTLHRMADKKAYESLLSHGWHTRVAALRGCARAPQSRGQA